MLEPAQSNSRDLGGGLASTAASAAVATQLPVIPLPWAIAAYVAIYAYSQWRNKKKLKRAQIEAAQLTINLRGENAGKPVPLAYGYCYVRGLSVWANVSSRLQADFTAYAGAIGRLGDGDVHPYLDAGTAPTYSNGRHGNVFVGSSSNVSGAILMQQVVTSCQEFDKLVDVRVDGKPISGKDLDGYALVVPGVPGIPFSTSRLFQTPGDTPDGTENLFVGLSYVTAFHWQTADRPYNGGRLPELGKFLRAGKVPLIERTGTAGNYTYSLATAPSFSDNAVRVLLDLYLAEDYGPVGLTVDDVDLESWYHAQEIAGCIVRGAGADKSLIEGGCFAGIPETKERGGFKIPSSVTFHRDSQNRFTPESQTAVWERVSDGVKQTLKFTPAFSASNQLTVAVETVGAASIAAVTAPEIEFDNDIYQANLSRVKTYLFQNVGAEIFITDSAAPPPVDSAGASYTLLYVNGPGTSVRFPSLDDLRDETHGWKHARCRPTPPTREELDDLLNDGNRAGAPYWYVRVILDDAGNATILGHLGAAVQYDFDNPPECTGLPGTITQSVDDGVFSVANDHLSILRYSFSGVMGSNLDGRALRDIVLESMPGAIIFPTADGKLGIDLVEPKRNVDESTVIGPDDIQGDVTVIFPDAQDLANRLEISYPDESQNFAVNVETFPTKGSLFEQRLLEHDNALRDDGTPDPARVLVDEAAFEGTTNKYSAHSLAANFLLQNRREQYEFSMGGGKLNVAEGDLVRLRIPDQGIDVPVRIIERMPVDAGGSARYSAKRFVKSDYAWMPTSDQEPVVIPEFDLSIPAPSVVTASYDATTGLITVRWELPAGFTSHGIVAGFEISRSVNGEEAETIRAGSSTFQHTEQARIGSNGYEFSVLSIDGGGVRSSATKAVPSPLNVSVADPAEAASRIPCNLAAIMPLNRRVTWTTQVDQTSSSDPKPRIWNGNPGRPGEYRFLRRTEYRQAVSLTDSTADILSWGNLYDRPGNQDYITLRVCPTDADNFNKYRELAAVLPGSLLIYFPYAKEQRFFVRGDVSSNSPLPSSASPDCGRFTSFLVKRGVYNQIEVEGTFRDDGSLVPGDNGAFLEFWLEPFDQYPRADAPGGELELPEAGVAGGFSFLAFNPSPLYPAEVLFKKNATKPGLVGSLPYGWLGDGWVRTLEEAVAQTGNLPVWKAERSLPVGASYALWRIILVLPKVISSPPTNTVPRVPVTEATTELYYRLANPSGTEFDRLPDPPPANTPRNTSGNQRFAPTNWFAVSLLDDEVNLPTATLDVFEARRDLAANEATGPFTVRWYSGLQAVQEVYRLSATRPRRDTLPFDTPWGSVPTGWLADPPEATATMDVWRGYRYRPGITRRPSPWARRIYQRRPESGEETPPPTEEVTETYWKLSATVPDAPPENTLQGVQPVGWLTSRPPPNPVADVFSATRTVVVGGTGAFSVDWVAGLTGFDTWYAALRTPAPRLVIRNDNTRAWGLSPGPWYYLSGVRYDIGWVRAQPPSTTSQIWRAQRTRGGVTRPISAWVYEIVQTSTASLEELAYRLAASTPSSPPNTARAVVPANWTAAPPDPTSTQDVFKSQRVIPATGTGTYAWGTPAFYGGVVSAESVYKLGTSLPDAPPDNTVWGTDPRGWQRDEPEPTMTQNVYRAIRGRAGVTQTPARWSVSLRRNKAPTFTETYYRLSATEPAAPDSSTIYGTTPRGWSASDPSATLAQDVWTATRTTTRGGTGAYTVAFYAGRQTSQTVWRLGTTRPAAPADSVAWDDLPPGWQRTRPNATATDNVYAAVRTREGVSRTPARWFTRLVEARTGVTEQALVSTIYNTAKPSALPAATRWQDLPSGWQTTAADWLNIQFRESETGFYSTWFYRFASRVATGASLTYANGELTITRGTWDEPDGTLEVYFTLYEFIGGLTANGGDVTTGREVLLRRDFRWEGDAMTIPFTPNAPYSVLVGEFNAATTPSFMIHTREGVIFTLPPLAI